MDYLPRHIASRLKKALDISPVVYLNGPRQAGKSTLAQHLFDQIGVQAARYVTLDRPVNLASANAAPDAFLRSFDAPVIIDEAQLAPALFRALKVLVDEKRQTDRTTANGQFLLTGSTNVMALPEISDALVGRMSILTLYPFTAAEATHGDPLGIHRLLQLDFQNMTDRDQPLIDTIRRATYPEIYLADADQRQLWFDGYVATILQRDVRQITEIDKSSVLPHLLTILASRTGGLINESDIAREAGLNAVTGKSYRELLKLLFLTFDVRPWHRNVGKRLVKTAKGYFTDTNLVCHLLDWDLEAIFRTKPAQFGHLLENFVASELLKQLSNSEIKASLYHFRTSDGKEVDFILERPDGGVLAIEVKRSENVTMDDFKGIKAFRGLAGNDFIGGVVLYTGKDVAPFGDDLWAVPLFMLW